MPGVVARPGDVIRLLFPYSNPPKPKFCLCVCIERGLFLVISSDPYRSAPADSQVKIFQSELECLDHDSFLDTSKAYSFEPQIVAGAMKGGVSRLDETARERIKHIVSGQGYLPREHKRLVLENL